MDTPMNSALLTVQQVAELLQVPVSWVYGRVRDRSLEGLPSYRLGKYWRFREADVLAWIERQRVTREHAKILYGGGYTRCRRRKKWTSQPKGAHNSTALSRRLLVESGKTQKDVGASLERERTAP